LNKIAIIELGTTSIKLVLAHILPSESFVVFDEVIEPIKLAEDMDKDGIIKNARIQEAINALKMFRALVDANEITNVVAVTTQLVREAKNQKSFLDEIYNQTGFSFKVLSEEDQLKALYTAIINTVDIPKGLIVEIGNSSIQLLQYNRRTILNQQILNFGALNFAEKFSESELSNEEQCDQMVALFQQELKAVEWLKDLEPEYKIIGVGANFESVTKISQKAKKYPLDAIHMYEMNTEDVQKVYEVMKPLSADKTKKIKGISEDRADVLKSAVSMVKALMDEVKLTKEQLLTEEGELLDIERTIIVSKNGLTEGLLFQKTVPSTLDKPLNDMLGFSLATISEYYNTKPNNDEHVYNLSMILFKQLKVLHKLSRSYVRVLRVASSMYSVGKRINFYNNTKNAFPVVLNSNINGIDHKELVLASFVVSAQNLDDLKPTEWIKYKDLLSQDDILAVQRLAVIVKLAASLDRFMKKRVIDVNCDILGDSVIMKTILDGKAVLEIREATKSSEDFKKAFNKNLEIL
jgi:exopolyphosphatase/guanosine-5'-triphosphate,3'-diphosphate pyrophosphatase